MHQEHNIPWNTLASHLKFVRENPGVTPSRTDLFPQGQPTQPQELNYFARTVAETILTFSETERVKYPKSFASPSSGKLFSDELMSRHPNFLNRNNQLIENWISRARYDPEQKTHSYSTSHGDLADVVKVLIAENEISTLLMLAQHPQIPLDHLHQLSWGHHFGFSRVAESALLAYLFFNVLVAKDLLQGGVYKEMHSYRRVVGMVTDSMDFNAQHIPHWAFFGHPPKEVHCIDIHDDPTRLRQYLKTLFSVLYRYDAVVRECGLDPKWEEEVLGWLGMAKTQGDHAYIRPFLC